MNTDCFSTEPTPFQNKELDQPKVSIIVPVYNAGEHLRPCLDTLVNQTLREIEIICVLDCPTDGSDKVVEEYAAKDNRIVVIRNEQNLNIGESRNVGLRAARGEYIGFSDHDDPRELDMYEKLYNTAEKGAKSIVFSGEIVETVLNHEFPKYLNSLKERISQLPLHQQLFYSLIPRGGRKCRMHITPNLYSHLFIKQHNLRFVDTKICGGEDRLFILSAIAAVPSDNDIALINHKFYLYLFHDSNTHDAKWYTDNEHVINYLCGLYDLANNIKWMDPILYDYFIRVLQISELYSCFKRDLLHTGPVQSIKSHTVLISSNPILKEIITSTRISIRGLAPTKRLFLILFKGFTKSNRF